MSAVDRLLELLRERSFARRPVVLASGRTSDWFVDCKQTVLLAEGHDLAGRALLAAIDGLAERPVAVAGVELGGCPLASAVALVSFREGRPLDAVYVRKAAKDHGSGRALEGDSTLTAGSPIAVVEDVLTTGGSTLGAIERLRAAGHRVVGVVALVDRGEGGLEAVCAAGFPVVALYTRGDFVPI